jgi:protein-disulfide isomerase
VSGPESDRTRQDEAQGTITIRLRRAHLWVLAGVLVAGAVGFLIGRETAEDPQPVLYGLPGADAASGTASAAPGEAAPAPSEPVEVDVEGRPAQGPEDAAVTMVEFVDYECPFCGSYARETMPRIEREYGDRIRYVSMHFPLSIHEHAQAAARAAECAYEQDRFWEYHDELFAHQDHLDEAGLRRAAERVGLDLEAFESCVEAPETRDQVAADAEAGQGYGVSSTPTFFIDGTPLVGAQPYEQIAAALDEALGEEG